MSSEDLTMLGPELEAVIARARRASTSEETRAAYEATLERQRRDEARAAAARTKGRLSSGGWPLTDETIAAIARGELEGTRALQRVSAWLSGPWPMLVLLGEPGTGKTTAAAHAVGTRSGHHVYVRETTLARWWSSQRHEREWRSVLVSPTLVVDELGTAPARDLELVRVALLEVVDSRQRGGLRTILIGNLDPDQFGRRYDPRMIDRLRPIGQMAHVKGVSMRSSRAAR